MRTTLQLKDYEERARQVRDEAKRLLESELGAQPPYKSILEKISQAADQLEKQAASPVKIGIVGEFSAGKTLLLNSLVGYTDVLPVSELPTTGNVTAIHIRVCEEGPVLAPPTHFRVQFLDEPGFFECLDYMLKHAVEQARIAQLRPDLIDHLNEISNDPTSQWPKIEQWAQKSWKASNNPNWRSLLRELIHFVRAYTAYGHILCSTPGEYQVAAEVIRSGLQLSVASKGVQNIDFEELPRPGRLKSRPAELSDRLLQEAFSLIHQVSTEVAVSRQVWDYSAEMGTEHFCLLDFPGLGSESSGIRDRFLCLRELKQVHTILIVLNGMRPGNNMGPQLYDELQKHRDGQDVRDMVLVVVGRFDQLPLQSEGEAGKLEEYLEGPLVEDPRTAEGVMENLLQELKVLRTCVTGAESLAARNRWDRIVLASPLYHLHFLKDKQVIGEQQNRNFFQDAELAAKAKHTLEKWQRLVRRFRPALSSQRDGKSRWAAILRWLDECSQDGGISQLRRLILHHVQNHGLAQRHKDIKITAEKLRSALRELNSAVPTPSTISGCPSEDRLQLIEQELRELATLYREWKDKLESEQNLTVVHEGVERPLDEVLQQEVVFRVFEWPEWRCLWKHVKNGCIRPPAPDAKQSVFAGLDDDDGTDDSVQRLPDRSEDFFEPFARSFDKLTEFAIQLVDQGVDHWLDLLHRAVIPFQGVLQEAVSRPGLKEELQRLRLEQGRNLVVALHYALKPVALKGL
ncbi:MAG: dynamin family protein, partial [Thermogemmata sp.]|nr:dynamin family protein [Thermogemmata sp.]